ncbi:acyltransferase family protein [Aeoliella sp.]|uniref:acyltransferase family protein n=1 Tax=Aeoliella sp. TaxID=2795800 RepID=UPI003CCC1CDD
MSDEAVKVEPAPKAERLMSLDALRGFDMFWIIGGESIAHAAAKLTGWAGLVWLSGQLEHPEWHGFTFYDLIFPLFLFMAGVSMPYSFEKRLARGDTKAQLYRHVIIRGLVLVLLGWVYSGILKLDFANMRYPSVLGRIGLAYMLAGLVFLNTDLRGRLWWIVGLLVGYWAALKFIPVPGFGAGDLEPGHTLTDWIDHTLLPGRLYKGNRDPEGILGTVPAVATALAGGLTGQFLKHSQGSGYFKAGMMALMGVVCLGLGWLWDFNFPINKNLWSSSFVLWCAGWSLIFLAAFYLVIDVWKFRRWAFFFVVIGSNSILIYMAQRLIDFNYTAHFLLDGVLGLTGGYEPLLFAIGLVMLKWLFLYLMYRKKIFLRV